MICDNCKVHKDNLDNTLTIWHQIKMTLTKDVKKFRHPTTQTKPKYKYTCIYLNAYNNCYDGYTKPQINYDLASIDQIP